ncbi:thiamine-phosphate kinase [Sphingosinicella sp. YJ22]|uniref:thiamine-phosphate kinase n=1 Tax=Sphingosinicella sp. YJ22 TaxID=1104780 RepID=UPI00140B5295|nr:thiamine-phosphate kinase [Sphingosinicella sp. YJ22]
MTSAESAFIEALRPIATDPGARALLDDAALLTVGGRTLVLTKDMIVEGIHYRADDPPEDVAWKLVAVNLSDLAGKGARPLAALLGYTLGDAEWDRRFAAELRLALATFELALIGGDTVSPPPGAPRTLSLTAIGEAQEKVPARAGARPGDLLWVSGSLGDGGAGLRVLQGELQGDEVLVRRYRAPRPRLEAGQALAPTVSAMMDVSDGLLIDAKRMAAASTLAIEIDLDQLPLSAAFLAALGDDRDARLFAATAGDDYELLFTAPHEAGPDVLHLAEHLGLPLSRIGRCSEGAGLVLRDRGEELPLPEKLGFEHDPQARRSGS